MEFPVDGPRGGGSTVERGAPPELLPLIDELRRAADVVARLATNIEACLAETREHRAAPPDEDDAEPASNTLQLVGHPVTARRLVGPVALHGFQVDPGRHTVRLGDRHALLTPNEWQLFALMLAEPGRTFTREELATGAWGRGYCGRDSEVEVYISRLRRKLETDPRSPLMIETVRGSGYRLVPPDDGALGRSVLADGNLEDDALTAMLEDDSAS
jgi:DNA-binding response OmpR family regulator